MLRSFFKGFKAPFEAFEGFEKENEGGFEGFEGEEGFEALRLRLKGASLTLRRLRRLRTLSGEGVPALHSVLTTGLSSRHGVEFGTLEQCRFAGLRPAARTILGAPKSLQNGL